MNLWHSKTMQWLHHAAIFNNVIKYYITLLQWQNTHTHTQIHTNKEWNQNVHRIVKEVPTWVYNFRVQLICCTKTNTSSFNLMTLWKKSTSALSKCEFVPNESTRTMSIWQMLVLLSKCYQILLEITFNVHVCAMEYYSAVSIPSQFNPDAKSYAKSITKEIHINGS